MKKIKKSLILIIFFFTIFLLFQAPDTIVLDNQDFDLTSASDKRIYFQLGNITDGIDDIYEINTTTGIDIDFGYQEGSAVAIDIINITVSLLNDQISVFYKGSTSASMTDYHLWVDEDNDGNWDFKIVYGPGVGVSIQRSSDGQYFNGGSNSWQVSSYFCSITEYLINPYGWTYDFTASTNLGLILNSTTGFWANTTTYATASSKYYDFALEYTTSSGGAPIPGFTTAFIFISLIAISFITLTLKKRNIEKL